MNLVDVYVKVRCDMPNCRNAATVRVEKVGFLRSAGLYLCDDCCKEVYETLAKRIVPKSPDNMLNKKIKTKGVVNEK